MGKVIAIVVVVLLVIGGGAVLYMNRDNLYGNEASPSPSSTVTTDMPMPYDETTQPSGLAEDTNQVSIASMLFGPSDIKVKKGTTVTWTNNDSVDHTVTENDGKTGPDSGTIAPGKTYTYTFNETGTYQYYCELHPAMTGTVTVVE